MKVKLRSGVDHDSEVSHKPRDARLTESRNIGETPKRDQNKHDSGYHYNRESCSVECRK